MRKPSIGWENSVLRRANGPCAEALLCPLPLEKLTYTVFPITILSKRKPMGIPG